MGFGIFSGAYLVTHIKTLGGTSEYNIVRVIGGRGTSSEPWKVKSISTCLIYTVSAMEIVGASYQLNYSLEDANTVYTFITNRKPDEPRKSNIDVFNTNPF